MFNDLGTELPGITKAVVAMSDFVTGYWYIVIAVIAATVSYTHLDVYKRQGIRNQTKECCKACGRN